MALETEQGVGITFGRHSIWFPTGFAIDMRERQTISRKGGAGGLLRLRPLHNANIPHSSIAPEVDEVSLACLLCCLSDDEEEEEPELPTDAVLLEPNPELRTLLDPEPEPAEEGLAAGVVAALEFDVAPGLRLRAAAMPESLSLSEELLELLLDEDEDEEDEEEEELLELELLLLLSSAFLGLPLFSARFAFLLRKTNSNPSARSTARASDPRKGNLTSNCCNHRRAMCFRATRVLRHTSAKLTREAKFCVTAMVSWRLRTACHHPPGTKMVSPGYCMTSLMPRVGPPGFRSSSSLIRGKMREKYVMASWSSPTRRKASPFTSLRGEEGWNRTLEQKKSKQKQTGAQSEDSTSWPHTPDARLPAYFQSACPPPLPSALPICMRATPTSSHGFLDFY
jgi:hypothetical protein